MATKRLPQKYLNSVFACEAKQASTGAAKLIGVREMDLSIPGGDRTQIPLLLGDNSAVYTVLTRPGAMQTECRHLLKDLHSTRDCISRLLIVYAWVATARMLADIGTKFPTIAVFGKLVPMICGEIPHLGTDNDKKRKRD